MKSKEQWQNEVLLDVSGELSPRRQRALHKALANDAELRAFADQLQSLRSTHATLSDADLQVSPFALQQIRDEATRQLAQSPRPRRTPHLISRSPLSLWHPAFLYGTISALLLLFGFRFFIQTPTAPVAITEDRWALLEWDAQYTEELDSLMTSLTQLETQIDDWNIWLNDDIEDDWALELLQRRHTS